MTADVPCDFPAGLSSHVSPVQVVDITRSKFEGHVYNLQTGPGWYFANGIVTHNCRCELKISRNLKLVKVSA